MFWWGSPVRGRGYWGWIFASIYIFFLACTTANAAGPSGELLFMSNKDGSWGLYTMLPDGSQVSSSLASKVSNACFSADRASIAYVDRNNKLQIMNSDGTNVRFITNTNSDSVAFTRQGDVINFAKGYDIYSYDVQTKRITDFITGSYNDGMNLYPDWSPHDRYVVYVNKFTFEPNQNPAVMNLKLYDTKAGFTEKLTNYSSLSEGYANSPRWSPDGTKIAYQCKQYDGVRRCISCDDKSASGDFEIYTMDSEGQNVTRLTRSSDSYGALNAWPAWSPDGAYIAYACYASSTSAKVCIMKADGSGSFAIGPSKGVNIPLQWIATGPGAPTKVTAKAGNSLVTVSFTPPTSDGGSPITSYTVTSNPGNITATDVASPITVKGLANGTAYTFTVTAKNAIGTGPASSPSNSVTPVTDSKAPGRPTGVKAIAGIGQATVSFQPPSSNGGSPITSYTVTSNPDNITATGPKSPITVKGLKNGTAYTFTVTAKNAIGTSPASPPSNSVIPADVPGAPTNVTAKAGNGLAMVSFKPPSSNGGNAIFCYKVVSSPGSVMAVGKSSPITIKKLKNGTAYTFRVWAANSVGTGPPSSPSNSVTPSGNSSP